MKNYEEMAQSVLKRRDTEIKRRKRAFLIGAPCAAAVLVGVVGIGAAVASQSRGKYIHPAVAKPIDNNANAAGNNNIGFDAIGYDTPAASAAAFPEYTTGNIDIGSPEIAANTNTDMPEIASETNIDLPVSTADIETTPEIAPVPNTSAPMTTSLDIAAVEPPVVDYTNPNSGINDIKVLDIDKFNESVTGIVTFGDGFTPYGLEDLDSFYGLRFNRLGMLHPNWTLAYYDLGVYKRETNDGFIAKLELLYTQNALEYTTESGAKIYVAAQYGKFDPVSDEMLTADKPVIYPKPETYTEYDENGNIIAQGTAAYDPTKNPPITPEPDEGVSTVNGYEALIYHYTGDLPDDIPEECFVADLDMNSRVRIWSMGLSEEEFLKVLDDFTK
ncbi:MAG: hypothetical protein HDT43_05010 [Ruminococcaceae bacterium]|nr:hypothetical protein [Oscillospiraceae bacterium]